MKRKETEKAGMGLIQVVQVVLIVLKFTNLINWPWSKVLLPTIICWCIALILLVFIGILEFISNKKPRRKYE